MPKVEYEIEEGNVDQWFLVTRKRDGKRFTVSKIDDTTSESSIMEVFDANSKERTAIKKALSKYLEQKVERTITIEVKGGTIIDVKNLPEGTNYEVIDHDVNEEV